MSLGILVGIFGIFGIFGFGRYGSSMDRASALPAKPAISDHRDTAQKGADVPEGKVQFAARTEPDFDPFTNSPTPDQKQWMSSRYKRLWTFSPYFDSRTRWHRGAWFYKDAYAIYRDSETAREHPEWILRDPNGRPLYIPFACESGVCPQYAGDFGNPEFREHWIRAALSELQKGYAGVLIDDVNMDWRISDGNGDHLTPIDPRTGNPMTISSWRHQMAEFMAEIRRRIPTGSEIVHNAIWFAGSQGNEDQPAFARQIRSATYVWLERGANDRGLVFGRGEFGFEALLATVDRIHRYGPAVVYQGIGMSRKDREHNLATYLLTNNGKDLVSSRYGGLPKHSGRWWKAGFEANIGRARGPRYQWRGLLRRDFSNGIVLVNQPGANERVVDLPRRARTLTGRLVSEVRLSPGRGVLLENQ